MQTRSLKLRATEFLPLCPDSAFLVCCSGRPLTHSSCRHGDDHHSLTTSNVPTACGGQHHSSITTSSGHVDESRQPAAHQLPKTGVMGRPAHVVLFLSIQGLTPPPISAILTRLSRFSLQPVVYSRPRFCLLVVPSSALRPPVESSVRRVDPGQRIQENVRPCHLDLGRCEGAVVGLSAVDVREQSPLLFTRSTAGHDI